MNASRAVSSARRSPLLLLLGGCALVGVCLLIACAVIAGYGLLSFPGFAVEPPPSEDVIRNELAALPVGNAASGSQLFAGTATCAACHSLEPDKRVVGPSLSGVAVRAAARKPGYSPPMYLYESVAYPQAFVVPGFPDGVMPSDFKRRLSQQELADVIAFLKSLR